MKNSNTANANCFEANIQFNDVDDARRWSRKFGSSAIAFRSGRKLSLVAEYDEDESVRLKGLCDCLFNAKITVNLNYEQYMQDQNYYVLVSYESCFGNWIQEFGDYDRETVEEELDDMMYNDELEGTKVKYKIIRCVNGEQVTIDTDIATLNIATLNDK